MLAPEEQEEEEDKCWLQKKKKKKKKKKKNGGGGDADVDDGEHFPNSIHTNSRSTAAAAATGMQYLLI